MARADDGLEHRETPGGVSGATTRAAHIVQHDTVSMARREIAVKSSSFAWTARSEARPDFVERLVKTLEAMGRHRSDQWRRRLGQLLFVVGCRAVERFFLPEEEGRSFRDAIEILAAKVNLAIDNHHRSIEVVVQRIGCKDLVLGTAFQHDRRSPTAGDINTAGSADRRREDVVQGSASLPIMTLAARGIDDR